MRVCFTFSGSCPLCRHNPSIYEITKAHLCSGGSHLGSKEASTGNHLGSALSSFLSTSPFLSTLRPNLFKCERRGTQIQHETLKSSLPIMNGFFMQRRNVGTVLGMRLVGSGNPYRGYFNSKFSFWMLGGEKKYSERCKNVTFLTYVFISQPWLEIM